MTARITTTERARARVAMTVLAGVVMLGVAGAPQAFADDSPYPSASADASVKIDANDSDLKLPEGATLAPAKVLDIKSVVEDLGGNERREDTNSDIKFALQAEVLFGKDSAKLSSAANGRINAIAEEIKKQDAKKVRVFGFTDNLGSSAHGDVLSKQRAEAVHNVLDKALAGTGIAYEIRGYGEQYPIADNGTEDGRKKNRRVEVSFARAEGSKS
ncbi:OmpA family protein [Streptomyces sp. NBC_00338]|uniref:OmpA family protein n=1 Tax=unclassified Streptomyces TaxID=2593676 RepID=UPI002256317F|nr:OmpA family protein [Streptomyces sp. NBC_00338]MCX5142544.1 OmpA family protein [Streptomyces sp. NBC_00338]WSU60999.1 OmpA family protein [Streptomyces sp. NBC_01104]